MPSFNIKKQCEIDNTFRVNKIMADFDVQNFHSNENFIGNIELPQNWNIGIIVGSSGTGKTTIAKELFPNEYVTNFKYTKKSVIDDMPDTATVEEIEKMFYSVGFGSVPSWLKPYNVLSNGEKMRVDLARAMLEKDFIVFDEFTSVVDRTVAQTCCKAINKAIKNNNKKIIVISCHFDIIEYLQPDWIFNTDEMKQVFMKAHSKQSNIMLNDAKKASGRNLDVIII